MPWQTNSIFIMISVSFPNYFKFLQILNISAICIFFLIVPLAKGDILLHNFSLEGANPGAQTSDLHLDIFKPLNEDNLLSAVFPHSPEILFTSTLASSNPKCVYVLSVTPISLCPIMYCNVFDSFLLPPFYCKMCVGIHAASLLAFVSYRYVYIFDIYAESISPNAAQPLAYYSYQAKEILYTRQLLAPPLIHPSLNNSSKTFRNLPCHGNLPDAALCFRFNI